MVIPLARMTRVAIRSCTLTYGKCVGLSLSRMVSARLCSRLLPQESLPRECWVYRTVVCLLPSSSATTCFEACRQATVEVLLVLTLKRLLRLELLLELPVLVESLLVQLLG